MTYFVPFRGKVVKRGLHMLWSLKTWSVLLVIILDGKQVGKGRWTWSNGQNHHVTLKFMPKTLLLRETSVFLRITWTSYA